MLGFGFKAFCLGKFLKSQKTGFTLYLLFYKQKDAISILFAKAAYC